jgi:hypothetical protein
MLKELEGEDKKDKYPPLKPENSKDKGMVPYLNTNEAKEKEKESLTYASPKSALCNFIHIYSFVLFNTILFYYIDLYVFLLPIPN